MCVREREGKSRVKRIKERREGEKERRRASGGAAYRREIDHFFCVCLCVCTGECDQGGECLFLHRLPTAEDERSLDMFHDIFGREKHREERDDMCGVGTIGFCCYLLLLYFLILIY